MTGMRVRHFAGHHGLGVLLFFLLLVVLIGAAVFVAVRLADRGRGARDRRGPRMGPWMAGPMYGRDPALEHARVRYARGELTRDEYLRVVNDLGGSPPPEPPPVAAT